MMTRSQLPTDSPDDSSIQPIPKRRWCRLIRFRLLTLLILVTIIAVAFAWWSYVARQQREAVAVFKHMGARIAYDYEAEKLDQPRYCPKWLVVWLGVDYMADVEKLSLAQTQVTDEGLKHLEGLKGLVTLYIYYTQVTDKGLKHLEGLKALENLNLGQTQVTDKGLKHLEGLKALETLYLHDTEVADKGLRHLEGLKELETLGLIHTEVTDEGVALLQKALPNCHIVHFK